jgi:hypothetical protein
MLAFCTFFLLLARSTVKESVLMVHRCAEYIESDREKNGAISCIPSISN